jgi:hypothetical protein
VIGWKNRMAAAGSLGFCQVLWSQRLGKHQKARQSAISDEDYSCSDPGYTTAVQSRRMPALLINAGPAMRSIKKGCTTFMIIRTTNILNLQIERSPESSMII